MPSKVRRLKLSYRNSSSKCSLVTSKKIFPIRKYFFQCSIHVGIGSKKEGNLSGFCFPTFKLNKINKREKFLQFLQILTIKCNKLCFSQMVSYFSLLRLLLN